MSKPSLTPAQVAILKSLVVNGPQTRAPLMQAASVGKNTITKLIEALEYLGLVIDVDTGTFHIVEITMAGRRALSDLENGTQEQAMRAPAQTRSKLEGFYRPPPAQWQRNNGHVNIASRGVGC